MSLIARLRQFLTAWLRTGAGGGSSPPVPPPPSSLPLLGEINAVRAARGLGLLQGDFALQVVAENKALEMSRSGVLSHSGFPERVRQAGFAGPFIGEVIARGQATPAEAVRDWLSDPPHAERLLSPHYTLAGCARAGDFWCVDLGGI